MNRGLIAFVAGVLVVVAVWFAFLRPAPVGDSNPSDIAVGETVAYHDFHSCSLSDGRRVYDFHFGGADRSRRAQFVARLDNMGRRTMRVVTNDPTLPKGHVRLMLFTVPASSVEGHNFGTTWTGEVLLINPRRPIEAARTIPSCGPERQ